MTPTGEQAAESSTATQIETSLPEIESLAPAAREEWLKNGIPLPKEPAEDKPADAKADTPDSAPGDKQDKPKKNAESRKGELDTDIQDLLAKRAQLRSEVEDLERKKTGEPKADPPPAKEAPKESEGPGKRLSMKEFTEKNPGSDWEAYQDYCADHAEKRAEFSAKQTLERETKTRQEAAAQEKLQSTFVEGIAEVEKIHSDVRDVILGPKIPTTPVMEQYLFSQGKTGVRILYQLGKDIANTERIAALSPIEQIEELVLLKSQLSAKGSEAKTETKPAPEPQKKSSSAAPIGSTVPGTSAAVEDEAKAALAAGDFALAMRIWNQRDVARAKTG